MGGLLSLAESLDRLFVESLLPLFFGHFWPRLGTRGRDGGGERAPETEFAAKGKSTAEGGNKKKKVHTGRRGFRRLMGEELASKKSGYNRTTKWLFKAAAGVAQRCGKANASPVVEWPDWKRMTTTRKTLTGIGGLAWLAWLGWSGKAGQVQARPRGDKGTSGGVPARRGCVIRMLAARL